MNDCESFSLLYALLCSLDFGLSTFGLLSHSNPVTIAILVALGLFTLLAFVYTVAK